MKIQPANRIERLPPYMLGKLKHMIYERRAAGADVIDLNMGNPRDAPPEPVVDKLREAVLDPRNSRYSVSAGIFNLRRDLALKYRRRWGVQLDPATETIATIGSKEGFSHLCLAMMGPGDTAVVGNPAFQIHTYAIVLAGGSTISVPLGNDLAFLERIEDKLEHLTPKPKMVILNYPHNPTAMTVEAEVLRPGRATRRQAPGHDDPRFRVRGDLLRRVQGSQLPPGRRSQGIRGRVYDHEQAVQHGRVAHRVLRRPPADDQRPGHDQGLLRLRDLPGGPDRRDHRHARGRQTHRPAGQDLPRPPAT